MKLRHVDLCSGIGGFALGFEWAGLSQPILFCDTEKWCQRILRKHWADVPIAEDVKDLANDPGRNVPNCDILTAGYPCQPFSGAGKRLGTEDPRHIYPYISRIIAQKRPAWVVLENVYGHLSLGLDEVLNDLESKKYATRTFILSSGAIVGAPHKRDRLWIIANSIRDVTDCTSKGLEGSQRQKYEGSGERFAASGKRNVGNTASQRQSRQGLHARPKHQEENSKRQTNRSFNTSERGETTWHSQSSFCGMDDGIPTRLDGFDGWHREPEDIPRVAAGIKNRADRIKGLGNAILPQIAMRIGQTIKQIEGKEPNAE